MGVPKVFPLPSVFCNLFFRGGLRLRKDVQLPRAPIFLSFSSVPTLNHLSITYFPGTVATSATYLYHTCIQSTLSLSLSLRETFYALKMF